MLRDRGACLAKARDFFASRGILEVDTPLLQRFSPVDEYIEVFCVEMDEAVTGFLHTSPEYAMKRLLCEGIGDIYQLGHVFRKGECGALHHPEFTMAEWYRVGADYHTFIQETADFITLFLGKLQLEVLPYREALKRYANIDYLWATEAEIRQALRAHGVALHGEESSWKKKELLHALLSFIVEPQLGRNGLTVLYEYPPCEAALAHTLQKEEEMVAERFEIYYKGVELANGYHELGDPLELRRRFKEANVARIEKGKKPLPIDELFLKALERGFPCCCGVAVGFDRLMLLRLSATHLQEVLPFVWESTNLSWDL